MTAEDDRKKVEEDAAWQKRTGRTRSSGAKSAKARIVKPPQREGRAGEKKGGKR